MCTECPLAPQPVAARARSSEARSDSPTGGRTACHDGAARRLSIVCVVSLLLLLLVFVATFGAKRQALQDADAEKELTASDSNSNDTIISFGPQEPPIVPGTWTEFGWLTRWLSDDDDDDYAGRLRRLQSYRRAQTVGFRIVYQPYSDNGGCADITRDGNVDVKDLLILLSAFGIDNDLMCPLRIMPGPLDDAGHYEHMTPETRACYADLAHDVSQRLRPVS